MSATLFSMCICNSCIVHLCCAGEPQAIGGKYAVSLLAPTAFTFFADLLAQVCIMAPSKCVSGPVFQVIHQDDARSSLSAGNLSLLFCCGSLCCVLLHSRRRLLTAGPTQYEGANSGATWSDALNDPLPIAAILFMLTLDTALYSERHPCAHVLPLATQTALSVRVCTRQFLSRVAVSIKWVQIFAGSR